MQRPLIHRTVLILLLMPWLSVVAGTKSDGPEDPRIIPQPIDFPCTSAGDSSFQVFTIVNPGKDLLIVQEYRTELLPAAFRLTHGRISDTIHPGRSITDTIWFAPKDSGLYKGGFEVHFQRGGSVYGDVRGKALPKAELIINRGIDSLVFATTQQIGPVERCIRIVNPSCKLLFIDRITIPPTAPFHLNPSLTFPLSVAPGSYVDVCVEFRPTGPGEASDSMRIAFNGRQTAILLRGRSRPGPAPALVVFPAKLQFPATYLGDTSTRVILLRNDGAAPLVVRAWAYTGANADQFSLDSARFPIALRANGADSARLTLRFNPSSLNALKADLHFKIDATDAEDAALVAVGGTGIQPDVRVEPAMIDMGDVPVNDARAVADTIVLRNFSAKTVTYAPLTIDGANADAFTLTGPLASTTIPPNGSVRYGVIFSPQAAHTYGARVVVQFTGGPTSFVPLAGRGTLPAKGSVRIEPDSLYFACTAVGDTARPQYIYVENQSLQDIEVIAARLAPRFAPFLTPPTQFRRVVPPGVRDSFEVRFAPVTPTATDAGVEFEVRGGAHVTIGLRGDGTARAEADPDRTDVHFPDMYAGSVGRDTINISNLSDCKTLAISDISISDTNFRFAAPPTTPLDLKGSTRFTLPIEFTGTSLGNYTGTLRIVTPTGVKTVNLTGRVLESLPRAVPDSIYFGEATANVADRWDTVKVFNTGNVADTIITEWVIDGASSDAFEAVMPPLPAAMAANGGDTVRIPVHYRPRNAGPHLAYLRMGVGSGPRSMRLAIALAGIGVDGPAPRSAVIDAGALALGDSIFLADTLVFVNPTRAPITITAPLVPTGGGAASFSIIGTGMTIPARGLLAFGVRFKPTAIGNAGATLNVTFSDGSHARVDLIGEGTPRAAHHLVLDTLTRNVNEQFAMHVYAVPPFEPGDGVTSVKLTLRYDRQALYLRALRSAPGATDDVQYLDSGRVAIVRTYAAPVTSEELFNLEMQGLVTGKPINEIEVLSSEVNGLGAIATSTGGVVYLLGCDIAHPVGFSKPITVQALYPTPAGESATLRYFAAEGARPTVRLVDAAGAVVREYALPTGTGRETQATLNFSDVNSGAYFLQLGTQTVTSTVQILIAR